MREELNREEVAQYNASGKRFALGFILALGSFVPLVVWGKLYGFLVWAILYAAVLVAAFRLEKLHRRHDIHTYREIVAFSEGKRLDEIQRQREIGKRPYQTALKLLSGMAMGAAIAALAFALMEALP